MNQKNYHHFHLHLHFNILFFFFVRISLLIFLFVFISENLLFKLNLISYILGTFMGLSFTDSHTITYLLVLGIVFILLLIFNTKTIPFKIKDYTGH